MTSSSAPAPIRLMRRRRPELVPVTPASIALFRLGEVCNHHCPMCSNTGRPEGHLIPQPELLRRADWLHDQGIRRVVLTGGEPTVHPAFWSVVERLGWHDIAWDINSNGSRFGEAGFARRAAELGLLRAIISLHSHREEASTVISGMTARGHGQVIAGMDELLKNGVQLMVNYVLTRLTLGHTAEFVRWCADRWGRDIVIKLVFPSTAGKGGTWEGIHLRYQDIVDDLREAATVGEAAGVDVVFENVPPCVVDPRDPTAALPIRNVPRSGFGETHYLEDIQGDKLYSIDHIEAWFNAFAPACRSCRAFRDCPGVAETYLRRHGIAEFQPL